MPGGARPQPQEVLGADVAEAIRVLNTANQRVLEPPPSQGLIVLTSGCSRACPKGMENSGLRIEEASEPNWKLRQGYTSAGHWPNISSHSLCSPALPNYLPSNL